MITLSRSTGSGLPGFRKLNHIPGNLHRSLSPAPARGRGRRGRGARRDTHHQASRDCIFPLTLAIFILFSEFIIHLTPIFHPSNPSGENPKSLFYRSSTTVIPPPPLIPSPRAKCLTARCPCKYFPMAFRSLPEPIPWTIWIFSSPWRRA